MIDRRKEKTTGICETDPGLMAVSDHEVLIAFRDALTDIYPSLVKVRAHAGDPWDNVSEGLFHSSVHLTFAGKYGIPVKGTQFHKYGFSLHCYRRIIHIECIPAKFPLSIFVDGVANAFNESDFENRVLVFRAFVGPDGADPSFMDLEQTSTPHFELASVALVDAETGLRFRHFESKSMCVSPDDVVFHWVVEDFDPEEHKFHKEVFYDDID